MSPFKTCAGWLVLTVLMAMSGVGLMEDGDQFTGAVALSGCCGSEPTASTQSRTGDEPSNPVKPDPIR